MRETTNYKLGLWDVADEVGRQAVNNNFSAIDAALKGEAEARVAVEGRLLKLAVGSYQGDDSNNRTIDLPFTPKAVYVANVYGQAGFSTGTTMSHGGLAISGGPVATPSGDHLVEIVTGGFRVGHRGDNLSANSADYEFHYWALG